MSLSLFIVVLGGRSLRSNVELHDVRWVVGESIEDTFPELRRQWLGKINGLHIDSYKCIKYIDGYKIDIVEKNKDSSKEKYLDDQSLWFINLGGYDEKKMYEVHEFKLIVAKKAIEAKKKAKNEWKSTLKIKHNDDYSGINKIKQIDDIHSIKRIKCWEVKLMADKKKRSQDLTPDWLGYMRIDKF
tara:strand:- start:221 stop:778 length:558 start_codon:yes stop_codon:yes gene_type:complete